jgi:hypothetical protein
VLKLRLFSGLREQQTTLNITDVNCSLPLGQVASREVQAALAALKNTAIML